MRVSRWFMAFSRIREVPDTPIKLVDVVALTADLPVKGLKRGQVGTVVEVLSPDAFEVEFSDDNGRTYAMAALKGQQLKVWRYQPEQAA
jgi:hypothetical protein